MKQFLTLLALLSILLISCQKEINFDTGTGNPGGGNTGGTYQPTTKDSYWKYQESGTFTGDYTLTSSGQTRTQNGINFTVITSTPATAGAEQLMGTKDHNLYLSFKGSSPNTGAPFDVNMLYANDTASVGYTWQHTAGQGNGFTAYTPGIILGKGISMTVAGKNYQNVIHSQIVLQYEIPLLGTIPFLTYDYYTAKNVGIIRVESVGDPTYVPGVSTVTDLVEYSIK